jgi:RNA polymerase sigma-70 factor, ECF subfamily
VTNPNDGLRELYAACYGRLVAVVGAISGSRSDAEDAVQEAFVRLIGKWSTVGVYDDPEAWLRRVALGVLANRRRKVRNGLRALWRYGRPPDDEGPTGDAVDMRRALAALTEPQRAIVVLHHYVGLSVEEIARELNVPAGTVKSRLSRGRAALAPMLCEGIDDHV